MIEHRVHDPTDNRKPDFSISRYIQSPTIVVDQEGTRYAICRAYFGER